MDKKNSCNQKRSIVALLLAQFFGAFNDNAWKVMVFTLATRPLIYDGSAFETSSQMIATLSLVIFLLPMMLFSLPAGLLADRMSKRALILLTKFLEVLLMVGCALSLYLAPSQLILPFVLLGLMGAQSALFSPAKYGILPELLPKERLSKGNGLLEMWTMIAIIAGTGLGPVFLAADREGIEPSLTWLGPLWLAFLSGVGFVAAFFISRVSVARKKNQKMAASLKGAWFSMRSDRILWMAILGSLVYWTTISLLGQNVLIYAKALVIDLEKGELLQGILPASFGMGIALGAFLSGRLSGDRIEYGLIPLGAMGFAISSLLLGTFLPDMFGTIWLLLLMGGSCGLLIVPLHAIVQVRSPDEKRGSIIALGNVLDIAGMIVGSLVAGLMAYIGLDLKRMLIVSAFLVLFAAIWYIRTLPKALVRLFFILLTRTVYRFRIVHLEHLPKEGPILLVANHISVIDALFVMASVNRPVRFLVNEGYFNRWYVQPIAKLMGAIPVSTTSSTRLLLQGMRKAGDALDNGEVVCIFPEGQVSHTGKMLPFRRGMEIITKGRNCPIVPIHIANAWGSIFSFERGRFFKKLPHRFIYSLTISFGEALPSDTTVSKLHRVLKEMEVASWMARKEQQRPIHHQFIDNVRKNPFRALLADRHEKLRSWKVLVRSILLARALSSFCRGERTVGILLPTGIHSIIANLSLTLSGRTAVNLSYLRGLEFLVRALKEAKVETLVTSRDFLEETPCVLPGGARILYVEDLLQANAAQTFFAVFSGLFTQISSIESYSGCERTVDVDDPLAVLFTGGTTGEPKGVVLSHFNISSNVESTSQIIPYLGRKRQLLVSLPLFHSFGYLLMWVGLDRKNGLIVHANPLDWKGIGELVKKYEVKLLVSTPSILETYIKRVIPDQFGSLQCVFTGAEKLSPSTRDSFESQFGIRPIEGYGCTECSPVIATSTLDIRQAGIYQVGTIPGSVGQTIPGVLAKVVHPETYEELDSNCEGLLLVKGPNVMQGYLNREDWTARAMHDGWFITGDLASIDQDGFITLLGRLQEATLELPAASALFEGRTDLFVSQ